jgi:hypothetical protein
MTTSKHVWKVLVLIGDIDPELENDAMRLAFDTLAAEHARLRSTERPGPADLRYLHTTTSRQTHRPVTTGHAEDLGLDPCGGDCKWYNVCDDHGSIVGHRTLALARSFAAVPVEWCEDCRIEWTEPS